MSWDDEDWEDSYSDDRSGNEDRYTGNDDWWDDNEAWESQQEELYGDDDD